MFANQLGFNHTFLFNAAAMVEKSYPELIPYLSSCKSPQMMMGSVIKNFFAQEHNLSPNDILSCSVMPCVRKQGEGLGP